ncbi:AmmeMemoRadiSam system protein B [Desulfovibrio sp. SGI.169]|uniref:AmmeMemoRadiSam system protein B n=1 Tax=Desulfovibrio sp. SGI.169 TaxID=3420561 RepID=UPI003CFCEF3E
MLIRRPVVAGRFYPAAAEILAHEARAYLEEGAASAEGGMAASPWGLMLPHAGHIYCGRVLGATLAGVALPRTLVILCPNHTGQGRALGVWPSGAWLTPLAPLPVDAELAAALVETDGGFVADTRCHLGEHAIEVILPFLQVASGPERPLRIVPVCVGTQRATALRDAGKALAAVLAERQKKGEATGVIVSSDMNHYEDECRTAQKDALALERALACDPEGLLATTERERISMCGAGPLALTLFAARRLGKPRAEFVIHDTSAAVSGDTERAVGYAGLRLFLS